MGDSIRSGAVNSSGYGVYVKEKLNGLAEVYYPDDYCRFAQYTLRYLYDWANSVDAENIEIVHWNNGLWEVLRLHGDDLLTPVGVYVDYLERVYKKIRLLFPNAKIIFALSTSVIEEWGKPEFVRYNKEIREYNDAARKLMEKLCVKVNDLYSVSETIDENFRSDWVHYNEEGSSLLADAVIKALEI